MANVAYAYQLDGNGALAHGLPEAGPIHRVITVPGTIDGVYQFCRDPLNVSRYLPRVDAVRVIDPTHSEWRVRGAARTTTRQVEIVEDLPGRTFAWRICERDRVIQDGSMTFIEVPGGGTEIHVLVRSQVAPRVSALARWFGRDPSAAVEQDLERLARLLQFEGHSGSSGTFGGFA